MDGPNNMSQKMLLNGSPDAFDTKLVKKTGGNKGPGKNQ